MSECVVCERREGSMKCPVCGAAVCEVCVREGMCWNCWARRKEEGYWEEQGVHSEQPEPAEEQPSAPGSQFEVNLNTGETLIEGTLRIRPDRLLFVPTEVSDIAVARYSLEIPLWEVVSCSPRFTPAGVMNGFYLDLSEGNDRNFVCDGAQAVLDAVRRALADRPSTPSAARDRGARRPKAWEGRTYRCPQCEEENPWSETICVHCHCPLPAHSVWTNIKILYSDQPFLVISIVALIGLGLVVLIVRLVTK
jgi:hypothetical protein